MKVKKRTKTSRLRGSRTAGWGFRQKHKGGHGNSGGKGFAGSGKRGDQKKQKMLMLAKEKFGKKAVYFGKQGMTSRSTKKIKNKVINLDDILKNKKLEKEINLKDYKILGRGEGFKASIIAKSASKIAIEKMQKAGGKIMLPEKKVVEKKGEEKNEKKKSE
jgi:large subunit ribosomal protein L15